jgi:multidrug efflux pump subunit AcrB
MSGSRFNLSALAVRERSVTLFLIVLVTIAGIYAFLDWDARKIRPSP